MKEVGIGTQRKGSNFKCKAGGVWTRFLDERLKLLQVFKLNTWGNKLLVHLSNYKLQNDYKARYEYFISVPQPEDIYCPMVDTCQEFTGLNTRKLPEDESRNQSYMDVRLPENIYYLLYLELWMDWNPFCFCTFSFFSQARNQERQVAMLPAQI